MGPYGMFVEHDEIGTGALKKEPPILLDAKTEREASDQAIVRANSLYPALASRVLIRVVGGDGSGRPIAEIRRPISN